MNQTDCSWTLSIVENYKEKLTDMLDGRAKVRLLNGMYGQTKHAITSGQALIT